MSYNVLMFGWEFPPHNSGGLGVACRGLAKALGKAEHEINFVLPEKLSVSEDELSFIFAGDDLFGSLRDSDASLAASAAYKNGDSSISDDDSKDQSGNPANKSQNQLSLIDAVRLYGKRAKEIARKHDFDIIHAHDWLTYPAGIAAQEVSGKPLVAHIHATEFDRTAGHGVNEAVYEIERRGFSTADHVLSVSQYTKNILTDKYQISADKITPAHNGINQTPPDKLPPVLSDWKDRGNKIVLFLGRQTIQKGPDHFLHAARKLLEVRDDVMFVMAGSGDMQEDLIELSAELGIADRVLFPGFVRGEKTDRLYQSADLYVLPSVSEPFGITPLESLLNRTPVLISKQSGVSEVVDHALKIDFWDIDGMTSKMDAALRYPTLAQTLRKNGHQQARTISWEKTAQTCESCYNMVTA